MDFRLKFNTETKDIEIFANDKVVDTVGAEVVESWFNAYAEQAGYVKPEEIASTEEVSTNESEEQVEESTTSD